MASSADLIDIFAAMAEWEANELSDAAITIQNVPLTAFTTFPTEDDVNAGLLYPYTAHGCETSVYERVGINEVSVTMVEARHTIWTALLYGAEGDELAALKARDAKWRPAYFAGLLKHLKLTDKNVTFDPKVTITPTGYDLFNRPEVGILITMNIMTRTELATGY